MPTLRDIQDAAERLHGIAIKTPLLESVSLSEKFDARIFIKPENLQRVGAFKFRGAYNRLCQLTDSEKANEIVAFSSGNHAQGVALAAKILGLKAIIVMPSDAPAMKRDNTLSYGAEIIEYDRETESREEIARAIAAERQAVVVSSFEDFDIIAGQGTAGLEIIEQGREIGITFDQFFCPVGGGGLISGCATAIKGLCPNIEIYGIEPEGFDDVKRSLAVGSIQRNPQQTGSVCDALLSQSCGPLTFSIMQKYLKSVLTVSDTEALHAVKYAWENLKLVVEPGGAVALAALLSGKADIRGKTICLLLSGGNVDAEIFELAIKREN
ncbi:MAG: pyridoxal-5'-phosphate-dependent protein [Alphaproteobacteria bacterium]|nr:MAG: pyridoxal-5'-phosphate-dependent protein [Alphaproteobacteria bacterium]